MDNEFELIFVVAYQKILQLSYVDKFLSDVHLEFRDKYKNELSNGSNANRCFNLYDFAKEHKRILFDAEEWSRLQAKNPKQMRSFNDSMKSKKTVASMIERKGDEKEQTKKSVKIIDAKIEELVPEMIPDTIAEDLLLANRRKLAEKLGKKNGKYVDCFFIFDQMYHSFILYLQEIPEIPTTIDCAGEEG